MTTTQSTSVKLAVGFTFYNFFVFFEEIIVDRYGIWKYLPFYKFGKLCVWDLGAMLFIGFCLAEGVVRRFAKDERVELAQPKFLQVTVGLMWLNTLVLLAAIVDRYKLWNYFPSALWIIGAILIIGSTAWRLIKSRRLSRTDIATQPAWIKIAAGVAFFNTFLFAEYLVLNPVGVLKHIPFYKVDGPPILDLGALLVVGFLVWWTGFRVAAASRARQLAGSPP